VSRPGPDPRRALALAGAELKAFWGGPSGGLALLVFLGLGGLWFYNSVAAYAIDNLRAMTRGGLADANLAIFSGGLANLGLLMALVTPLTTMRAFAGSDRGGHLDLWRSWPLGRWELALGLHLAAAASLAILAALGLAPFLALMAMGVGGWGALGASLLGLAMAAAAFPAVGLAVGALARTPLAAALATLGTLGLLWAMGFAAPYLPAGAGALIQGLAFGPRLARLAAGLLDLGDAAYFLALTAGGLWLAKPVRD
jgi:ABC-type transport system involved in multi-copper enzyme maturation permease subunit